MSWRIGNSNGNVTGINAGFVYGVHRAYAYDPLNRLTNVIGEAGNLAQHGYDLAGNLPALRYGNGVTNQYQFDRNCNRIPSPANKGSACATKCSANHLAMARTSGQPVVLRRQPVAGIVANRTAARVVLGGRKAGTKMSWDEYPFASGRDPLSVKPPSVQPVPWLENSIQGGIISGCYTIEGITVGTPYVVVVTP